MRPCLCGHPWDDHGDVLDWPEPFQPPQRTRPCCDCRCRDYQAEASWPEHAAMKALRQEAER